MAPARMFAKDNSEGVVDNVVTNLAKDNSEGVVDNVVTNLAKDNSEGVVDNVVANFAKDNSEGVVDNVVTNVEDSMCSIEPTTLPQASNSKSLLEGRQFFHSRTFQPMSSEYLFGDEDSDDEVDDEIAEREEKRRLDRFVDATQHEKRLMLLWNSFKRKQRVVADGHIPWACEAFSTLHRLDFLESPELRMCWNVFMVKLWEIGLLDANTMNNCGSILGQNSEKKN
ncbi:polycomb group protein EMBRYONIC FLOWER 2-like [Helianthus annuus]|uniref:polycomb group protein EMBRYONIC FLOWER 2-like n=1 Tax=Helianthus annuus TaxID=4232 RepID=UPI001652C485|nr:polycomb group protein EMBRYONIC FLOWER 2-like [Helianthus annuus]